MRKKIYQAFAEITYYLDKICEELREIKKELKAIRRDLDFSKEKTTSAAISDGIQKAVQSSTHDAGKKDDTEKKYLIYADTEQGI